MSPYLDSNSDNGFNNSVYSIRYSKNLGDVYIFGGSFINAGTAGGGGQTLLRVAVGAPQKTWQYKNLGITNGTVYDAIDIYDGNTKSIIIGGNFTNSDESKNIIGFDTKSGTQYFSVGSGATFNPKVGIYFL